jgi:hypothetical protein
MRRPVLAAALLISLSACQAIPFGQQVAEAPKPAPAAVPNPTGFEPVPGRWQVGKAANLRAGPSTDFPIVGGTGAGGAGQGSRRRVVRDQDGRPPRLYPHASGPPDGRAAPGDPDHHRRRAGSGQAGRRHADAGHAGSSTGGSGSTGDGSRAIHGNAGSRTRSSAGSGPRSGSASARASRYDAARQWGVGGDGRSRFLQADCSLTG